MTTLQAAIKDRLAADAALTAALPTGLGFTVWDRWLTPEGPGSTPDAFDVTRAGRLKRSVVVLDGGEAAFPGGSPGDIRRWDSFPQTYVFAEAHATGKAAAHAAVLRIEQLLIGWEVVVDAGRTMIRPESQLALEDSAQFPGNIVVVARWRATGVRALVPAS